MLLSLETEKEIGTWTFCFYTHHKWAVEQLYGSYSVSHHLFRFLGLYESLRREICRHFALSFASFRVESNNHTSSMCHQSILVQRLPSASTIPASPSSLVNAQS